MRSTHAESTRCAVRIQSAFRRHGEVRTYGQWRDAAATVQRWGRGEISRRRVRDLRETEMEGTIRDLLSEMKTTAAPSDNAVASTTVSTSTTMATTAPCSSSSGEGDGKRILLAAESLCGILKPPAEGGMGRVGGGRRKRGGRGRRRFPPLAAAEAAADIALRCGAVPVLSNLLRWEGRTTGSGDGGGREVDPSSLHVQAAMALTFLSAGSDGAAAQIAASGEGAKSAGGKREGGGGGGKGGGAVPRLLELVEDHQSPDILRGQCALCLGNLAAMSGRWEGMNANTGATELRDRCLGAL